MVERNSPLTGGKLGHNRQHRKYLDSECQNLK